MYSCIDNKSYGNLIYSHKDGTDFVNIYSNGWCEQGGSNTFEANTLVNLLHPFKDTNYGVVATPSSSNNSNSNYSAAVGSRTTSQFNLSYSNNTTGNSVNFWRAYGYVF